MLPYFVYPKPEPLNGSDPDSIYTPNSWLDRPRSHFNKRAENEHQFVLLFDTVLAAMLITVSQGIELYRIVPDATHLIHSLDKNVFSPLKTK